MLLLADTLTFCSNFSSACASSRPKGPAKPWIKLAEQLKFFFEASLLRVACKENHDAKVRRKKVDH